MTENSQEQLRERVRELKHFYTNLLVYGVIIFACIIVWLSMGGGAFWPIWVVVALGLSATLQAMRLGQLSALSSYFPFLHPNWEEEQIKKQTTSKNDNN